MRATPPRCVASRVIFEPAEVTVRQGETVTFAITNTGNLPHDFVLGDEAAQEEHAGETEAGEEEMEMESMAHGEANAVSVPTGTTVELTWTFDGETEGLVYGCHEPRPLRGRDGGHGRRAVLDHGRRTPRQPAGARRPARPGG